MRLRLKLFIPLLVFTLLFASYARWNWLPKITSYMLNQETARLNNHLKSISESIVPLLLQNQLANIHETLDSLLKSNPSWKRLILKNARGNQLYPITDLPTTLKIRNKLDIHLLVKLHNRKIGSLQLVVDNSATLRKTAKLQRDFMIVLVLLLTISILAIMGLLEWIVRHPLRNLSEASEELSQGNYDATLPKAREDEVGDLIKSFDQMRSALKQYRHQVEEEIIGHKQTTEELLKQRERLAYHATHDSLTKVYNRREFELRLAAAVERARHESTEHALVFIDLDHFKTVNDTCGHLAGDELLKKTAKLIRNHVRDTDTVARLGGDEFAVLLEFCPSEVALRIVNDLHSSIQKFTFHYDKQSFSLGASIGVTFIDSSTTDMEDVIAAADSACYYAKQGGRNRYHVYNPSSEPRFYGKSSTGLLGQIVNALDHNRFVLYAQPVQPLGSHDPDKKRYEILVRMKDEKDRLVMPSEFIPTAERYNLIAKLDRWVIANTLAQLSRINQTVSDKICFCINLSGTTMNETEMYRFINAEIRNNRIDPRNVCFEITETAAISNVENAETLVTGLRKLGCQFALDDFGSGFASFEYLKKLPMDYLKIDGSFVREIVDNPVSAAMVKTIHDIGKVLKMKTIAEFVENDNILEKLKLLGVDYVQGNGIARPSELEKLFPSKENLGTEPGSIG